VTGPIKQHNLGGARVSSGSKLEEIDTLAVTIQVRNFDPDVKGLAQSRYLDVVSVLPYSFHIFLAEFACRDQFLNVWVCEEVQVFFLVIPDLRRGDEAEEHHNTIGNFWA